ncbi:pheromone A receptor-domain-containing protein [Mycena sp. CBHHK59/15]|nr:pheromone A receptor-domain-containing protein [Mycena sp. CBHHK59/15]
MSSALPAPAFIASALVLVPLPWHWRVRNVSALSIIAWLSVSNLTYGINAIIWAGNVNIVVPVWCDIVTKLKIGATMALPACCLCLALQLYHIASSLKTPQRGRQGIIVDLVLCWGLPVIIMALHYVVQGHRFDIVEDFGCRPAIYISLLSILLVDLPPGITALVALVYCGLALLNFFRRRLAFTRMLKDSNSPLTTSRYVRLMAMTTVIGTWTALSISLGMYTTYSDGLRPWTSWSDVHSDFSRIDPYPIALIPKAALRWTYFLWWALPISSLFFFLFFSFGEDVLKEYGSLIKWLRRAFGSQEASSPHKQTSSNTSMYVHSMETLRDSPQTSSTLVGSTSAFPHFTYKRDRESSRLDSFVQHLAATSRSHPFSLPKEAEKPACESNIVTYKGPEYWAT